MVSPLIGSTPDVISPNFVPEVINPNPVHVQVGFNTPGMTPSLETTKLSSLPGTPASPVITSPPGLEKQKPHPQKLPKPQSIEEFDKHRKDYAPIKELLLLGSRFSPERDSAGFCLDLVSLKSYVAPPPKPTEQEEIIVDNEPMTSSDSTQKMRSLSFELKDVVSSKFTACLVIRSMCYI